MAEDRTGLTRRGWVLLAVAAGQVVGGFVFGVRELYPVAVAATILVVVSRAWVGAQNWGLRVSRHISPARVPAGVSAKVELTVVNVSATRSPPVAAADPFDGGRRWARFTIAPLAPGQTRTASYLLPTSRRGKFRLGPLELSIGDPFGLARSVRIAAHDATLTVHPVIEHVSARSVAAHYDHDTRSPMPVLGRGGDEFYALREYTPGDSLRLVHWKSTARLDDLVVRQPENLWRGRLTLAVDLRTSVHDPESLEKTLSAAASVAVASIRAGLHVRLVTTSGIDTGYGSSHRHSGALLDALAGAGLRAGDSLGEELRAVSNGDDPLTVLTTDSASEVDMMGASRVAGLNALSVVIFDRHGDRRSGPESYPVPARSRYVRVPMGASFRAAWEGAPF
jgi:uncharacterized protein (DUF58 family)